MKDFVLALSVFLACAVESVEALTIVLAVGTTRSWRSAWWGVGAGLLSLVIVVGVLGPAITSIPINALRAVVGGLLLIFGLQWLRKAILRAGGLKDLHDEDAIFDRAAMQAYAATSTRHAFVDDWYAFTVSFKGVVLEGLEVAFIVVTFGANQGNVPLAVAAAGAAIVVVVIAGLVVHRPLARVPENTLKFAVGVMLTSFGTFWATEGVGAVWPGNDAALIVIAAIVAGTSLGLVSWLKRDQPALSLEAVT